MNNISHFKHNQFPVNISQSYFIIVYFCRTNDEDKYHNEKIFLYHIGIFSQSYIF